MSLILQIHWCVPPCVHKPKTCTVRPVFGAGGRGAGGNRSKKLLDDRQITHLICVRLKHLLYDFLEGVLGLLYRKQQEGDPEHPPKNHVANVLGGHRLDE